MAKQYKIKRYQRIYRRSRGPRISPGKILLIVASVGLLFFLGWSLYDPIYNLLSGNIQVESTPSPLDEPIVSGSSEASSSEEPVPEDTGTRMAWLPMDIAKDSEKLVLYAQSLKDAGLNTAVLEVKNEKGEVLFATENETVLSGKAVTGSPIDLAAVCKTLTDNGITPMVQIHAFRDPLASMALKDAAVRYKPDTHFLWLDNDPKKDGKAWLNPNAAQAQDYVLAVMKEAIDKGARGVLLDSVQFPEGVGLNLCSFGKMDSKQEVLSGFMKRAREAAGGEIKVLWRQPADANFGGGKDAFGGDAITYGIPGAVDVMPRSLAALKSEEFKVEDPAANGYEAVKAALEVLKAKAGDTASQLLPIVAEKNTEVQKKALDEAGFTDYFVYQPDGDYSAMAKPAN